MFTYLETSTSTNHTFNNNHPHFLQPHHPTPTTHHTPHQTRTREFATHCITPTSSETTADPAGLIEARERGRKERHEAEERKQKENEEARVMMATKRKGNEGLCEPEAAPSAFKRAKIARTTGGPKETVPTAATSTSNRQSKVGSVTTLAPQHTSRALPSNKPQRIPVATATRELDEGRRDITEQEQEEMICTLFAALEISDTLASSSSVPGRQPPKKKTPGVANGKQAVVKASPVAESIGALGPDSNKKSTGLDWTSNVTFPRFGGVPASSPQPTSLFADRPTIPLFGNRSTSPSDLPPTNPFAHFASGSSIDPRSVSLLAPGHSGSLASTFLPARAPSHGVNVGKNSSAHTNLTAPNRLFGLPQELQDEIFELAYTEPSFTAVTKLIWDVKQEDARKSKGTPRVDFPPPKVNEWMVSKQYFRSAAKAWVEAQTSLERVQNRVPTGLSFMRFRSSHPFVGTDSGLFYEFGTAFQVAMPAYFNSGHSERILQCRRVRHLICLVGEEFLSETDRGFAWEVEFTDEELMSSLMRADFKIPSSVETLQTQPGPGLSYVNTKARKAIFATNLANLQRVMWQRKLKKPHPGAAEADHGALYLGSKVSPNKVPFTRLIRRTRR
jgi:hypothetical protein